MRHISIALITFAGLFFCTNLFAQCGDVQCFGESLMPDVYEEVRWADFAVFTGDASTEEVDEVEIFVRKIPAHGLWVRKKSGTIACYAERPPHVIKMKIMKDLNQSKNHKIVSVFLMELVKKGGYMESIQVICESDLTPTVIEQLYEKLGDEKDEVDAHNKKLTPKIMDALTKFQHKYNLPANTLNYETLGALGIHM